MGSGFVGCYRSFQMSPSGNDGTRNRLLGYGELPSALAGYPLDGLNQQHDNNKPSGCNGQSIPIKTCRVEFPLATVVVRLLLLTSTAQKIYEIFT
jgi:hypothetical protein